MFVGFWVILLLFLHFLGDVVFIFPEFFLGFGRLLNFLGVFSFQRGWSLQLTQDRLIHSMICLFFCFDDYLGFENLFSFLFDFDFAPFSTFFRLFSQIFVFLTNFRFLWCSRLHRLWSLLNNMNKSSFALFLFFHLWQFIHMPINPIFRRSQNTKLFFKTFGHGVWSKKGMFHNILQFDSVIGIVLENSWDKILCLFWYFWISFGVKNCASSDFSVCLFTGFCLKRSLSGQHRVPT